MMNRFWMQTYLQMEEEKRSLIVELLQFVKFPAQRWLRITLFKKIVESFIRTKKAKEAANNSLFWAEKKLPCVKYHLSS